MVLYCFHARRVLRDDPQCLALLFFQDDAVEVHVFAPSQLRVEPSPEIDQ